MNAYMVLKLFLLSVVLVLFLYACKSLGTNVKTAENVDINKYMGTWFEIARFDTSFQRGTYDAQAYCKLNPDGTVSIKNFAIDKNGRNTSASARGYAPNKKDFSKLRISFFRPFYADYYILELDPNYKWALVGGSSKKYLWILSRTKNLDSETLNEILALAKKRGYDTSKLLFNENLAKWQSI